MKSGETDDDLIFIEGWMTNAGCCINDFGAICINEGLLHVVKAEAKPHVNMAQIVVLYFIINLKRIV